MTFSANVEESLQHEWSNIAQQIYIQNIFIYTLHIYFSFHPAKNDLKSALPFGIEIHRKSVLWRTHRIAKMKNIYARTMKSDTLNLHHDHFPLLVLIFSQIETLQLKLVETPSNVINSILFRKS